MPLTDANKALVKVQSCLELDNFEDIKDEACILVGGFGNVGVPFQLLEALAIHGPHRLTVVANNCGTAGHREPGICSRKAGTAFQNETGRVGWPGEDHYIGIPDNSQWKALTKAKAARFPGAEGRIPNFVGAEAAAQLLQSLDEWTAAAVVKANPDAPQWPVRERVLADGKILYMAVPRLAGDKPFYFLDGEELEETPRRSSSIKGAARVAQTVSLHAVEPIDIVVTGCVAVGRDGARLGKGGGYSDLEFALLSQAAVIGPETLVVTTAHPLQVQDAGDVPTAPHDLWVDVIVTPDEVIRCAREGGRPGGRMRWDQLSDAQLAAIPVLRDLRPA